MLAVLVLLTITAFGTHVGSRYCPRRVASPPVDTVVQKFGGTSVADADRIREVADNVAGHGSVMMNASAAERLGLADGDLVEVRSPLNKTRGHVMVCEGIRPDTLLMIGQFDHWATPFAKDLEAPSMNALMPMMLELTDATGSSADLVKVNVARVGAAA